MLILHFSQTKIILWSLPRHSLVGQLHCSSWASLVYILDRSIRKYPESISTQPELWSWWVYTSVVWIRNVVDIIVACEEWCEPKLSVYWSYCGESIEDMTTLGSLQREITHEV